MKKQSVTRSLTQQGAFRRDRNALNRAEKHNISDAEIINQMASTHSKPYTAQAYAEAAGALIHTRANMNKESPIYDALEAILEEKRGLVGNTELA